MAARGRLPLILLLIVVLLVGAGALLLWPYLEGSAPVISLEPVPTHLGRENHPLLTVTDEGMGLQEVQVLLQQQGKEALVLESSTKGGRLERTGSNRLEQKLDIQPLKLGLSQGPAVLVIKARDRSFRGWLHGNQTVREINVTVDTEPPKLGVLSRRIYLSRGGSALVIYEVSEDASQHGVTVGDHVFTGHRPWPKRPRLAMCYFAFADDLPRETKILLWAQDEAGNLTSRQLQPHLRWKKFRHDNIKLSKNTVDTLGSRFAAQAPAGVEGELNVFSWVNTKFREENHQRIQQAVAASGGTQYWKKTFDRPMGKPMSGFGDRRTYFYEGKEVSKAVHLGVDLADVANSPINSVADGKVLFAEELGIYGNCVIVDHGLGVTSLYGHLSSLDVKPGQQVARGDRLGLSGATGLALGDHLHFSVLVGGVFVNPTEWWDSHWIEDNVTLRFSEAGVPAP